jgi:hypothetical protein
MGYDGEHVDIDALDYLRTLTGRRPGRRVLSHPLPRRSYGVDVPATPFHLHEWDIHIVCRGTDDASGAGGTYGLQLFLDGIRQQLALLPSASRARQTGQT